MDQLTLHDLSFILRSEPDARMIRPARLQAQEIQRALSLPAPRSYTA